MWSIMVETVLYKQYSDKLRNISWCQSISVIYIKKTEEEKK